MVRKCLIIIRNSNRGAQIPEFQHMDIYFSFGCNFDYVRKKSKFVEF